MKDKLYKAAKDFTDAAPGTAGTMIFGPIAAAFIATPFMPTLVTLFVGAAAMDLYYNAWKYSGVEFKPEDQNQKAGPAAGKGPKQG